MEFNEAISIVEQKLNKIGIPISTGQFDGIIVKKLAESNTLDDNRNTNQTHIAITGKQMDIFPSLCSNAYFDSITGNIDEDYKKYFVLLVPVILFKKNCSILGLDNLFANVKGDTLETSAAIVRSKRQNQTDQLQISLLNLDGKEFVSFRKKLHANDFIIFLKKRQKFEYCVFGLPQTYDSDDSVSLSELNNYFYKDKSSNTIVPMKDFVITSEPGTEQTFINQSRVVGGENIILYGVPGSGKSYTIKKEYCSDESKIERVVFYPDYSYSDFVGQILPRTDGEKNLKYEFTPGPFTSILKKAYNDPKNMYYLIIEEINRGNAPAIFGDIFQLLDRDDSGNSEYGITNLDIAKEIYSDPFHKVKIPSNLSLLCTMNTSDQNVFTLDTAFQRRWNMRLIENSFNKESEEDKNLAESRILDTSISWEAFCQIINDYILEENINSSSEDKRLGTHFIQKNDLKYISIDSREYDCGGKNIKAKLHNQKFAEKVIKYLWDDAFKFQRQDIFEIEKFKSLEEIIQEFTTKQKDERFDIFVSSIRNDLAHYMNGKQSEDGENNEGK